MSSQLESIVASVAASRRYRRVSPEVVARLARAGLEASGGDVRAATKKTKAALHQVYGAFVAGSLDGGRVLAELRVAAENPEALREVLVRVMARHASTRERSGILDRFWSEVCARTGAAPRVLDVGCGLNPLAAPWMNGIGGERYVGLELDAGLVELLQEALDVMGVRHELRVQDVLGPAPLPRADLVLAMKLLPTLEQQQRGAGLALLDRLDASQAVVSFPRRSLSGRDRGMTAHYAESFEAGLRERPWRFERLELPGELVYVLSRTG